MKKYDFGDICFFLIYLTILLTKKLKEDMDANSKRKSKSGAVNLDSAFSSMKLDAQPKQKKTSKPASSPTSKASEPKINESSLLDLESNDGKNLFQYLK